MVRWSKTLYQTNFAIMARILAINISVSFTSCFGYTIKRNSSLIAPGISGKNTKPEPDLF